MGTWSKLFALSAVAAMVSLMVFERFSSVPLRKRAANQLWAHLLAMGLYSDEPVVVMRSLVGVVIANLRLIWSVAIPILILAPMFWLAYQYLDPLFPRGPGALVQVLTVRAADGQEVRLETPEWIKVDSQPVHDLEDHEVSWRLRANREGAGTILVIEGPMINKRKISFVGGTTPIQVYGVSMSWSWWFTGLTLLLAVPIRWLTRDLQGGILGICTWGWAMAPL